jgi:hypothetical protein
MAKKKKFQMKMGTKQMKRLKFKRVRTKKKRKNQ